ncbi:MAG: hypothetical protein EA351_05500 [Gemmatimonadales bacterium]|nr:MAG: hypothetical protein EA351_05500 [Gemmatimonadales bacterium]
MALKLGYAARGPVGVEALPGDGASVSTDATSNDSEESREEPLHPGADGPSLVDLLRMALSEKGWEWLSRGSAIRRAAREVDAWVRSEFTCAIEAARSTTG